MRTPAKMPTSARMYKAYFSMVNHALTVTLLTFERSLRLDDKYDDETQIKIRDCVSSYLVTLIVNTRLMTDFGESSEALSMMICPYWPGSSSLIALVPFKIRTY